MVTALSMTLTAARYRKQPNGWKLGHLLGGFVNFSKSAVHLFQSGVNYAESTTHQREFCTKPSKLPTKVNGGNSFN